MKNLFSNPRFLHIFYGSVVALLGFYIYLTNTPIEKYKTLLSSAKAQNRVTNQHSESIKREWSQYAHAYSSAQNRQTLENVNQFFGKSATMCRTIDSISTGFDQYISRKSLLLIKSSLGTCTYFSEKEVNLLQDEVNHYYNATLENIVDEKDKEMFRKMIDTSFNKPFSTNFRSLPSNLASLELENIRSNIKLWEVAFMNYYASKYNGCGGGIRFDKFLVGLFPNATKMKVGETFIVDIAAIDYASYFGDRNNATFSVNGQPLVAKDGLAHYETHCTKVGKQNIRATISLKNRETGVVESFQKEYTFEVLPK
jgi:hypothetical protein